VAKLPVSFRNSNVTTRQFRELYSRLPAEIQDLARACCLLFDENPRHPSLRIHTLRETHAGKHSPGSISVAITMGYRAIYAVDGDINVWYWIGSHADYDKFTGAR
jgi:hypothetical protein